MFNENSVTAMLFYKGSSCKLASRKRSRSTCVSPYMDMKKWFLSCLVVFGVVTLFGIYQNVYSNRHAYVYERPMSDVGMTLGKNRSFNNKEFRLIIPRLTLFPLQDKENGPENDKVLNPELTTANFSGTSNVTKAKNQLVGNVTTYIRDGLTMPSVKPPLNISPVKSANFTICVNFLGGLGNQMFQFATMFGLAAEKRMSVLIDKQDYLANVFKLEDINLSDNRKNICNTYVPRGERRHCGYDERLATFPANNNYRLQVYLQSWKYFYDASIALRKQFTFQDSIQASKITIIDSVLIKHNITSRSHVTLIGVHVRRGDMVNHRNGYNVASSEYLSKAVRYFIAKGLENPIFIVCSNDINWTQNNMPKGIKLDFIQGNSAAIDLAVLASCDHVITTVGTFGWWAAWISGGNATFYEWPAKEGSGLRKQFSKDYEDYFYPGWIGFS